MVKRLFVFLSLLLFIAAAGNFIFHELRLKNSFNETRQRLMLVATNAAVSIDGETLLKVPLQMEGEAAPEYRLIQQKLIRFKEANPFLKYIYIVTAGDQPGIMRYLVDADPLPKIITATSPSSFPGDKYDTRQFPEILNAYDGPAADKKITVDAWGTLISGYAPIRDPSGKVIAILGADVDATGLLAMQENSGRFRWWVVWSGLLFLISLVAGRIPHAQ
jgi:hypothetical protein